MSIATNTAACLTDRQSVFNLKADLPLTADEISQLLADHPEEIRQKTLDARVIGESLLDTRINAVELLTSKGTLHHIFKLQTARGDYYLKTSKLLSPWHSYNFYIDQWMTRQLNQAGYPAANIIAVNCTRTVYQYDYLLMEEAPGTPLAQLKNDLSEYRRRITQLGAYLASIHSLPADMAGLLDGKLLHKFNLCRGESRDWQQYIFTNFAAHLDYCVKHSIFSSAAKTDIEHIFITCEHLLEHVDSRILHGDLNDQNVFCSNALTVIDWEDALAGDPIFDIALWGTFIQHHENLDALLAGYETVAVLPHRFMLRYWLYYLRIIISKTIVRHRFGYYKTDKIPAIERISLPLTQIKQLLEIEG